MTLEQYLVLVAVVMAASGMEQADAEYQLARQGIHKPE